VPFNVDDFDIQPNTDGAVDSQHFMTFEMPDTGEDMVDMLVEKIHSFRDQLRLDHPNTFWLKGKVTFGSSWPSDVRMPTIRIEMRGRRRALAG
jgi:hypothetical protein